MLKILFSRYLFFYYFCAIIYKCEKLMTKLLIQCNYIKVVYVVQWILLLLINNKIPSCSLFYRFWIHMQLLTLLKCFRFCWLLFQKWLKYSYMPCYKFSMCFQFIVNPTSWITLMKKKIWYTFCLLVTLCFC